MSPSPQRSVVRIQQRIHRMMWSSPYDNPWQALSGQFRAYDRAQTVVRVFYASALFLAVQSMPDWPAFLRADALAAPWPSAWIPDDAAPRIVPWILGAYLCGTALVAALPAWRALRIVYFVVFVQYVSLISGFGSTSHLHHAWLWISGLLILLPDRTWAGRTTVEDRHYFVSVVWICQLVVMFFYTLTGLWKIVFALHGVVTERASSLGLEGFGVMVAQRDLLFNDEPVLARFFIDNPPFGWLLFVGAIYIEFVALNVAFRPRLHRLWGILLIAFHTGTELAMGFTFPANILAAGIFFVCSPFAPDRAPLRHALADLPGVYFARRTWRRRQARPRGAVAPAPESGAPDAVGVGSPIS